MDFAGASDLADRLMPMTPDGLKKATEGLPKQAQGIVTALTQHINQLQQELSQAQADVKYGLTKTLHQDATKLQIEHLKDKRAEKDTRPMPRLRYLIPTFGLLPRVMWQRLMPAPN